MSHLHSSLFFKSVLDTLREQIAIIDDQGKIQWVNAAWEKFYYENTGPPHEQWQGGNYLHVLEKSSSIGDDDAVQALAGIRTVMSGADGEFQFEYPCHSPSIRRWFLMRFRPLEWNGPRYFVSTHLNITDRKIAEIKLEKFSISDALTGIANRRYFDTFIENQWRRSKRLGLPISLLFFDIDYFKNFNDHYGHVAGDDCLQQIGLALDQFSRRPDDIVARYGGEEFCIVLGNTDAQASLKIAENLRSAIQGLSIPHEYGTDAKCVTVSVGVATLSPAEDDDSSPKKLIEAADQAVYAAKAAGRNKVCVSHFNKRGP